MGNDHAITAAVSVAIALLGLAVIAALVSSKSNTAGVFTAGGGALSQAICKALSPVTGSACGGTLANVTSSFNTGCVTVEGQQYCP
jgi:hypothetical protein